ncbi:MAG: leucine-rich repeat domain-containing protein [Muribaculaceae bacterium]|nr:leucine-rich repeat domain-containing protein [Muribaculaceae bacterium]
MRKVYILMLAMVATLGTKAQINCQPGQLSTLVTDKNATTLTITGQMDARDFKFIVTELTSLETLDLENVDVVAYENLATSTLANDYSFAAGEVPAMGLAGQQHLTTVVLPRTARTLGTAALAACPALTSVTMGENLETIGDYAISACTSLSSVTIPAGVTTVGTGAFSRCEALNTIDVATGGDAQLTIGDEAFLGCKALTTVNLGENLVAIGNSAFTGTALTVLDLSSYKHLQSIGDWAYTLTYIGSATLPASLKHMGKGLFMYNDRMQSATLPAGIDSLASYTFAGNSQLTTVDLGKIKAMGDYALYSTPRIEEITIPERVTFIGTRAMAGMTGIERIFASPATAPALGENVWEGVDQPNVRLIVNNGNDADTYLAAEQWREFMINYQVLLGDADEDMMISIGDINVILNILTGITHNYPKQTDGDQDGEISISDVNYVINRILGRAEFTYIYVSPNTTDEVSIHDFSIAPGETRDVELVLNNEQQCSHMQCDINLPEGLSIVGTTTAQRAANHTLATSKQDSNYRILCYSLNGERITGNEGAVVTLKVKADENFTGDYATITVDNVVLADRDHGTLYAPATTATVGSTTGINDITSAQVKSVRYYNVAGQESSTPFTGVNMVVTTYTDGTTSTSKVIK